MAEGMEPGNDIDPELLKESGRASAIQDLADQARVMADRAMALENSTRQELVHQVKRYRRTAVFLAVGLVILMIMSWRQIAISSDNKMILGDLDRLVTFVDRVEREREREREEGNPLDPEVEKVFQAALETRRVICASTDPGMSAACTELGG